MRLILFLILGYLLLVAIIFVSQRQLLYFPSKQLPNTRQLEAHGLQMWPATGSDYQALLAEPQPPVLGTIMIFHGNAGAASDRVYYLPPLLRSGFRVVLAEYPGYGGRNGSPSEDAIVADATQQTRQLMAQFPGPIYLWGESLGAAVAAAVASEISEVGGLVLITPWDQLANVAARHYWYLPVRWLLHDRFDSAANLTGYANPVAVLVAEQDTIIPPRHANALYEKLSSPKQLWRFTGAGHNSWPIQEQADWWLEVIEFTTLPIRDGEPPNEPEH